MHIAAPPHVALQHREDHGHRLHGIDLTLIAHNICQRASIVTKVGAYINGNIALTNQLREVVVILQGSPRATQPQPTVEEEEAAHNTQITLQREQAVEQTMKEFSHFIYLFCNTFYPNQSSLAPKQ